MKSAQPPCTKIRQLAVISGQAPDHGVGNVLFLQNSHSHPRFPVIFLSSLDQISILVNFFNNLFDKFFTRSLFHDDKQTDMLPMSALPIAFSCSKSFVSRPEDCPTQKARRHRIRAVWLFSIILIPGLSPVFRRRTARSVFPAPAQQKGGIGDDKHRPRIMDQSTDYRI